MSEMDSKRRSYLYSIVPISGLTSWRSSENGKNNADNSQQKYLTTYNLKTESPFLKSTPQSTCPLVAT